MVTMKRYNPLPFILLGLILVATIAVLAITTIPPADKWVEKSVNQYGVTEYTSKPMAPEEIAKAGENSAAIQTRINAYIDGGNYPPGTVITTEHLIKSGVITGGK
jgi:hypothetical protein